MKSRRDLVKGLLEKAESDFEVASLCTENKCALDIACFHAQQAAEKVLKAYLVYAGIEFPFTHNLEKLVTLAVSQDSSFRKLYDVAAELTPYAVEIRYDAEFWPELHDALEAKQGAEQIKKFCLERMEIVE